LPIDAHLMIDDPARHIDDYLEAGADSITIHVEVTDPIVPILAAIRTAGRAAGLSLRPATDLASLDPYRDALDIVMVMTVEPGRGGQAFMDDVAAERIPAARDRLADPVGRGEVHVDGGVNGRTAVAAGSHGADVLVVGSALFGPGTDLAAEIAQVRSAAEAARRHDARS
jgi:ribulose-phosphate 3-epimerase